MMLSNERLGFSAQYDCSVHQKLGEARGRHAASSAGFSAAAACTETYMNRKYNWQQISRQLCSSEASRDTGTPSARLAQF